MNERHSSLLRTACALFFVFVATFAVRSSAMAAVRTWDGGGADGTCGGNAGDGNKWSCAANWSSDATPTSVDSVVFDSTSTKNATIDASFQGTVTAMTISATYSGTITQARALTVSGAYSQAAGTFTGSGDAMSVTSFTLSGGTFTAPSGTLTDSGAWTHTAGGTFTHNSGTVTFTSGAATLNASPAETFNNVTINKTTATALTVTSGQTHAVVGTLTLTDGQIATGTLDAQNGVSMATTFDGGTGTVQVSGSTNRTITLSNGGTFPAWTTAATATNVTYTGNSSGTVTFGAFSFQAGTFNGGAGNVTVTTYTQGGGTFTAPSGTLTSGSWTHTAGGTFTHNSGTVTFTGTATLNASPAETFSNLTKTSTSALTVTSGQTHAVVGTLTLDDGTLVTGTLDAQAGVTMNSTFDGGTGTVQVSTSANRTITLPTSGTFPAWTTAATATNVTYTGNASGTVTFGAFSFQAGTFNGGAGSITVSSYTQGGGTFTAPSGTLTDSGAWTHTAGGTFTHNSGTVTFTSGAATVNASPAETFNNLTVNKTTGTALTVTTGQTHAVVGTLTLSDGQVATGTLDAQNGVSMSANFDGGTGTIQVSGTATRTITLPAGGTFPVWTTTATATNVTYTGHASGTVTFGVFSFQAGTWNGAAGNLTFSSSFTQGGGSFSAGSGSMSVTSFTLSGGTFTSTTGTFTDSGAWTHTGGGTFTHNSGTVTFTSSAATLNASPAETFNNLTINKTTATALTVTTGQTHAVVGTLTLTDGQIATGTLDAQGDLSLGTAFDGGTGTVTVTGSATRTVTLPTSGTFPGVTFSGANVTVTGNASGTCTIGAFSFQAGTFNGGAGNVTISSYTQSGGTFNAPTGTLTDNGAWTHTAGGTFTHNGGTVAFGSSTATLNASPAETFNNLTISKTTSASVTVTTGQTHTVIGTLALTDGKIDTGTIDAQGDMTMSANFDGGTGTVTVTGNATRTIVFSNGGSFPILQFSAPNVTVTGNSSGTVTLAGALPWSAGTFNGGAGNVTITTGTFTLSGGSFTAPSGTFTLTNGGWTHTAGGTFAHNNGTVSMAVGTINASPAETFYGLTKTGTGALTVTSGQTHTVAGPLTLTDGTLVTGTLDSQGDLSMASTFDGGTGLVTVTGNATRSTTLPNGGSFPQFTWSAPNMTVTGNSSGTVTFANAMAWNSGTFNGGAGNITITTGGFTLSGGSFTAPSGTFTITVGGWTHTAGGTFTHNNGTVAFTGGTAATINASPNETFGSLTVSKSTTVSLTVTTGQTHAVTGTLALTDGKVDTGTLDAQGGVTLSSNFDGGTGLITVTGNAVRAITLSNGGSFPQFTWNAPNATVTGNSSGTVTFANAMVWSNGTFNGGAGSVTITTGGFTLSGGSFTAPSGTFTITAGNWTHTGGGTFAHNSGLVTFTGAASTLDASPAETFNGLTISKSAALTVASGQTHTVLGTFTLLSGGVGTGTLDAQGAVTLSGTSSGTGLTGTITVTGNSSRTVTLSSSSSVPNVVFNAPNVTVTGNSSGTATFASLDFRQGTFNGGAGTVAVTGAFSLSGGTFNAPTANLNANGSWSQSGGTFNPNNGTVQMLGTNPTITSAATFYNLRKMGATDTDTFTLPSAYTVTVQNLFVVESRRSSPSPSIVFNYHVTLQSDVPGAAAHIDVQGSSNMYGVSVQDIVGDDATPLVCLALCTDLGGNTNINFGHKIVLTDPTGDVDESGTTATFTVVLFSRPTASVTVPVASNDTGEVTVSASTLTFTTGNWDTPQTVTLTGVDDATGDGAQTAVITVGAATSADTGYNGLSAQRTLAVKNFDNDATANAIDFNDQDSYVQEDVKGTVGYLAYDGSSFEGTLKTGSSGAAVDISASKIKAGCRVDVAGTEYVISKVRSASGGIISIGPEDATDPYAFSQAMTSGTVNAITCGESDGNSFGLHRGFVVSGTYSVQSDTETYFAYDAARGRLWIPDEETCRVHMVDLETGSDTPFSTKSNSSNCNAVAVYDADNDAVWVANRDGTPGLVKFAASGAYFNGTLGNSSINYGHGAGTTHPLYDTEHHVLWYFAWGTPQYAIASLDPVAMTQLTAVQGLTFEALLAYDPTRNTLWAAQGAGQGFNMPVLIKMNADTGAYANGTLAASQYSVPVLNNQPLQMRYDATLDSIWMLNNSCGNEQSGALVRINAGTLLTESYTEVGRCPIAFAMDEANDRIWVTNANGYSVEEIVASTGVVVATHSYGLEPGGIQLTPEFGNDLWVHDGYHEQLDRVVTDGVPFGAYYTVTTAAGSQLASNAWSGIETATITNTLDGQDIFYSLSFDGRNSFKVFTGSAWRVIASNKASDHGGTEGVWYARNNASSWTAASVDTAQTAVSEAVASGSNNQMTATDVNAISGANWIATGGSTNLTTLNMATTFYTDDPHNHPSVGHAAFTFGARAVTSTGNNSRTYTAPVSAPIVFIAPQPAFVPPLLSNILSFLTGRGGSTTPPPPPKSPPPPGHPKSNFTPVPVTGTTAKFVGKELKTKSSTSVYYVDPNVGKRRPYMDAQTYFTYNPDFKSVDTAGGSDTADIPLGPPMLPNPGTVLVKIPSDPKVYATEPSAEDPTRLVLRPIPDEATAKAVYGNAWADYIIDVPMTLFPQADVAVPIDTSYEADTSRLLRRVDLKERK